MSELAHLMAVFGAVDDAVTNDRSLLPTVAALVPAYDEGAAGWYADIRAWAPRAVAFVADQEDIETPELVEFPTLDEALAGLNADEYSDTLAQRRLLAVALLARVRAASRSVSSGGSAFDVPDWTVVNALAPLANDPALDDSQMSVEARSVRLHDLLADAHAYPGHESWGALMDAALAGGLISRAVADRPMVPLTWTVVPSTEAGGPAVAFETLMTVVATPLQDVMDIVDPSTWTSFKPPWCSMEVVAVPLAPPGAAPASGQYLEVVSLDCPAGASALPAFRTVLDFTRTPLGADGSGWVLEYRLASDQVPGKGDGLVSVDEGSLVVRQVGRDVEVITTKRVQFRALSHMPPLEAAALAWFVWVFGYYGLAEVFIEQVGKVSYRKIRVGGRSRSSRGPGVAPPWPSAGAPQPAQPGYPTSAAQTTAAMEEALEECWRDMRSSWDKVAEGQYSPAAYLTDAVKLSAHLARHGTLMVKFWSDLVPGRAHGSGPR